MASMGQQATALPAPDGREQRLGGGRFEQGRLAGGQARMMGRHQASSPRTSAAGT
jgi:hypothetical protein